MDKINESIMYLYKSYLVNKKTKSFTPNDEAIKKGILISNNTNQEIIDIAINQWGIDGYLLNQTFHKSLNTIIN